MTSKQMSQLMPGQRLRIINVTCNAARPENPGLSLAFYHKDGNQYIEFDSVERV